MNCREIAYFAVLKAMQQKAFIHETLDYWLRTENPSSNDFKLASEIACGAMRMQAALEYCASKLCEKGSLKLKLKERALLDTALYQYLYLTKIPLFALTDETIKIAKKHLSKPFANFLNAILRKAGSLPPSAILQLLPKSKTPAALAIAHSYPLALVADLAGHFSIEQTEQILQISNLPSHTHVRIRYSNINDPAAATALKPIQGMPNDIMQLTDSAKLPLFASSANYYLQNAAPWHLMQHLAMHAPKHTSILDLCASPGGKLLAAYDLFPQASLTANDVSEAKAMRLSENIAKYAVPAAVTIQDGQCYSSEKKFDLVILDVPCSNSGVLNKRPEARWRYDKNTLAMLAVKQLALLQNSLHLVNAHGEIWYLTCSILPQENDELIAKFAEKNHLKIRAQKLLLPADNGIDGGYACALTLS